MTTRQPQSYRPLPFLRVFRPLFFMSLFVARFATFFDDFGPMAAGPRVPRLIDAKGSAARQRDPREQTPTLILDRGAADIALLHLSDKCLDVVAHQIELVCIVFVGRMHGNYCRR